MWRSRARLGIGLGAIVMALAWLAVPAVAVAGVAQPGAGTLQVSPATAQVPGSSAPYTFAAAQVGTAHPAIDWLPLVLVVIGLVLVAGTAGLAAFRPLRRGGPGTARENVRTVPRTGPPPSVAVRDTGNRPALTVHIEPRADATVTTTEERPP